MVAATSNNNTGALSALGRIGIVCVVAAAFIAGLLGTVYFSLRSAEVKVPDVLGKNLLEGESMLERAGLNIRKRTTRPSTDVKPDTILDQLPRAGEVVKVGQTVAVVLSRVPKEGESVPSTSEQKQEQAEKKPDAQNANANSTSDNQNESNKKSKDKGNKEARNKNSGSKTGNKTNNRNGNNSNANNRNTNLSNRPAANANGNRNFNNSNANKRAPVNAAPPPPLRPPGNARTP